MVILGEFNDEQLEFQSAVRTLLKDICAPPSLRAELNGETAGSRKRWDELAAVGVQGALIAPEFGGLGLKDADLALVLEEIGYAGLPEPLMETAFIVAPVVEAFGTSEQRERWLPAIASGAALGTVQLAGAPVAPYGLDCDVALVEQDSRLHLVVPDHSRIASRRSMDSLRRPADLRAATAVASAHSDLEDGLAVARQRGFAATSAVLNGVSMRMLSMSIEYAKARQQFGRAIASFQAVRHLLAEASLLVETARSAAWYAVGSAGQRDHRVEVAASAAKIAANKAARLASYNALQVHGGIGFTWEHDLHLWMKRARALEESHGGTGYHETLLGRALLSSNDLVADFGPVAVGVPPEDDAH